MGNVRKYNQTSQLLSMAPCGRKRACRRPSIKFSQLGTVELRALEPCQTALESNCICKCDLFMYMAPPPPPPMECQVFWLLNDKSDMHSQSFLEPGRHPKLWFVGVDTWTILPMPRNTWGGLWCPGDLTDPLCPMEEEVRDRERD